MKLYRRLFYSTCRLIGRMDGEDSVAAISAALFLSLCAVVNLGSALAIVRGGTGLDLEPVFSRGAMVGVALLLVLVHYRAFCTPDRLASIRTEFHALEAGAREIWTVGGYAVLSVGLFMGALTLFP